jgi:hypothetical protein
LLQDFAWLSGTAIDHEPRFVPGEVLLGKRQRLCALTINAATIHALDAKLRLPIYVGLAETQSGEAPCQTVGSLSAGQANALVN